MARDFNIRDCDWDLFYPFHSVYSNSLFDIVNLFDLKLSVPILQISTCYTNNSNDVNSVINLIFLHLNLNKIDNYQYLYKKRVCTRKIQDHY